MMRFPCGARFRSSANFVGGVVDFLGVLVIRLLAEADPLKANGI